MDHKSLLRKYIEHVVASEGTDFLPVVGTELSGFTELEVLELFVLAGREPRKPVSGNARVADRRTMLFTPLRQIS